MPNAVALPRRQPCAAAVRSTSAVSKPGVSVKIVIANKNENSSVAVITLSLKWRRSL